jgi:hypothetical protein
VYGDQEGDTLLVGWGSTYGPIHDAAKMAHENGEKVGALHLRHVHPLPNGLEKIFEKFKRIVTVEMNDQGVYGFGQLATILRARYCEPKIQSVTKTDGLTFRVKEILDRVFKGRCTKYSARRRGHRTYRYRPGECEIVKGSRAAGSGLAEHRLPACRSQNAQRSTPKDREQAPNIHL